MNSKNAEMAINIYGIMDSELERMHRLLQLEIETRNKNNGFASFGSGLTFERVYGRIEKMQQILCSALAQHDSAIQEKVAEMAFTGVKEEKL